MIGAVLTNRRRFLFGASALAWPLALRAAAAAPPQVIAGGRDQSFDRGWRFLRGEGSFEAAAFDDSGWRPVDLPHDWSVEDLPGPATATRFGPFDKAAVGGTGTGFTVGGEGWYRKRFSTVGLPAGSRVRIVFGGVAVTGDVWINGQPVGSHRHAYTPFVCDLTPHLRADGDNVIAVRARNIGRNSRWYAGSGIYRSVTLDVVPGVASLAQWGPSVWTRRIDGGQAIVEVASAIHGAAAGLSLRLVLRDAAGRIAAQANAPARAETRQTLRVPSAKLWSPDHPNLYTLETTLMRGPTPIDRQAMQIGLRIVTMDPANGVRINGRHVVLRGGCVHHDNGLLGAAAFADADDRRVRLLRARGYNAIRSSHNPSSASFRRACDRHGMLLIEEAFDSWHIHKRPDDHSTYFKQDWRQDLADMVLPARHHPSVIMWSIGNEITERSTDEGLEWSWQLANAVRQLDPTRPVTAGLQEFLGRPMTATAGTARAGHVGEVDQPSTIFLDVAGYNYKLGDIEGDHRTYPHRLIYASETYPRDAWDYARLADRAPYFLGEFVWTAMDYVGEAGLGLTARVPAKNASQFSFVSFPVYNAFCGDIDLIGHQKPQSLYRDVVWGISPLECLVRRPLPAGEVENIPLWGWSDELPSWTWPDAVGQPLAVRIYTSGDRVELRLNGAAVGAKALAPGDKMKAEFQIPYRPGTLEAVAYRAGRVIGRRTLATVGAPAALRLTPEPVTGRDRSALRFVEVAVLDAQGRPCADADIAVALTVDGPAELIGFGNAGPRAIGSLQAPTTRTFQGRALAILRATGAGTVRVEVRSPGLQGGRGTITLT